MSAGPCRDGTIQVASTAGSTVTAAVAGSTMGSSPAPGPGQQITIPLGARMLV
jgi:hypothetical protein